MSTHAAPDASEDLPQYADAFKSWLVSVVAAYPAMHEVGLDTWIAVNMQVAFSGLAVGLGSTLHSFSFATSLRGGFLTVLLTVFMALYLTIDATAAPRPCRHPAPDPVHLE